MLLLEILYEVVRIAGHVAVSIHIAIFIVAHFGIGIGTVLQ